MSDADCTPSREPRSVAASQCCFYSLCCQRIRWKLSVQVHHITW